MFVSLFTISLLFFSYWNTNKRGRWIYFIITFTSLFLLSGLRGSEVGTDTENYLRGFINISDANFSNLFEIERWEYGYIILNKLTSYFSVSEQAILIVTSFIFVLITLIYIYKNSNNIVLSVYLFITLYLYLFSFNVIRQSIAIVFIAFGIKYITNRNFFKYAITVIVATLFHESAIVFILLYFIYGMKLNLKSIFNIIALYFLIFVSIDYLINFFISHSNSLSYLTNSSSLDEGTGFLFPLINFGVVLLVSYVRLTNKTSKKYDFYVLIVVIGFLNSILSMEVGLLLRLNYYFFFLYIVIIPITIGQIVDKKMRILVSYLVILFMLLYFCVRLMEGWHGIYPYELF